MERVAYFVGDDVVASRLSQLLESDGTSLKSITGLEPRQALALLGDSPVPTLIVDCRPDHVAETTIQLMQLILNGTIARINVFTVGNGFLPLRLAGLLDLLTLEHFELDDSHAVNQRDRFLELTRSETARTVPDSRQVEAFGIGIKTFTPEFFPVMDDLLQVADRNVTLLLVGETGAGKTTLAKFVHSYSHRRGHPFQHLACGALPPDLIESELFGHVRGAFTGADRNKVGRFQAAGRGTLLLDEIDSLDVKQQTKLLKVIETGEYELVGSPEAQQSEARLIVASNVNLNQLVDEGKFRLDLYYRLNVLEFRLPPLRERSRDLVTLTVQFIEELMAEHGVEVTRIHREFLNSLRAYSWPGNLRELKNHLRRAVLFCKNGELTVNELAHKIIHAQFAPKGLGKTPEKSWKLIERVAQSEKELLRDALAANGNNRTRTAKALGISRVGLYKKLRRLGLIDDGADEIVSV